MTLARKIILQSPVSDEALLPAFVEQCLHDPVSLIAIVGPGSAELEDAIDWLIVGDGTDPSRFDDAQGRSVLCTTSHPDEAYDEVVNMVECWELDRNDPYQAVRL